MRFWREQVVDAWQLQAWEDYRDVRRLGRKSRLNEAKRSELWNVFTEVHERLQDSGKLTGSGMFTALAEKLQTAKHPPYEYAVIDEAQDVSVAQLRFLAALGGDRPQSLFFSGDLGQRIFQQPFSWSSLGVQILGRSNTLRINYRTSHQIRSQADRLLDPEISDVDGTILLSTMHLAKGLEFRAVAVMACDDEVIPSQERIEATGDTADIEDIYNTERQLLYVACTRARDHLLISSTDPASEFLDDIMNEA
jgi:superfamily I DNA/RNA helicase